MYRIYRRVYQVSSLLFLILVMTIIVIACTSTDSSILFVNGTNSGYPRACINGVWRYVCNNGWSSRNAEHACSLARFTLGEIGKQL